MVWRLLAVACVLSPVRSSCMHWQDGGCQSCVRAVNTGVRVYLCVCVCICMRIHEGSLVLLVRLFQYMRLPSALILTLTISRMYLTAPIYSH